MKQKKETPLWKALLLEHRLPWRYKQAWEGRNIRFIDYILFKNINKIKLRLNRLPHYDKEDITVIIGVKGRCDNRMINTLKSIRNQDYPQNLINIMLIDYDNKKELIPKLKEIYKRYDIDYIRVDNKPLWSKAHATNVGIKKAKTKYILSSDIDIIFERNYIKEAIKELQKHPFQVILSKCFDLPKININKMDYDRIKSLAQPRFKYERLSLGINLALTYFYNKIKGYDEKYKLWGYEDDDLIKRLEIFGLNTKSIEYKSVYFHQWHKMYEGVKKIKGYKKQIEKNKERFKKNFSIIRNKNGWGEI